MGKRSYNQVHQKRLVYTGETSSSDREILVVAKRSKKLGALDGAARSVLNSVAGSVHVPRFLRSVAEVTYMRLFDEQMVEDSSVISNYGATVDGVYADTR